MDFTGPNKPQKNEIAMRFSPITVINVEAGVLGTFRLGMSLLIDTTWTPPVQIKRE